MPVQVLGISGSPIRDSNTDRAVQAILAHTGLETEFVKLSELEFAPCRACLGCINANECVVLDDARSLAAKFRAAPAFMERMFCFRHRTGGSRGKRGVAVVTTACPPGAKNVPPAAATALSQIGFWMAEEGIEHLGSLVLEGNLPCIRCGRGDTCEVSGIKMMHGPDATVASVGVHTFEEDDALVAQAAQLGQALRAAVLEE
ncbi:MAG: flavodoxin family protein [Thermoguttaceae bacterium]